MMKKKILIIEDDTVMRENTAEILQLANYEVISCENGKSGLEKAIFFKPDLIICDILMPELDGYGVLQIMMRNKNLQGTPFIFMSAKTKHEDIRKGMDLGASDYITKPFEESELLSAIASRLKSKEILASTFKDNTLDSKRWRMEEIEEIFQFKDEIEYKQGNTIYCEGNVSNHIYYIIHGEVKTFKVNRDGKELITDIFTDKSFFGFTSLLKNKPYYENAEAIKPTKVLRIQKHELQNLIKSNPQLALNFMDVLADNLNEVKEHLMHLAYDSVRKKTANAILYLQNKEGNEEGIEMSRSDLASILGIAKETLTRTLTDFKDERLIKTNKNRIQIIEHKKLLDIR